MAQLCMHLNEVQASAAEFIALADMYHVLGPQLCLVLEFAMLPFCLRVLEDAHCG